MGRRLPTDVAGGVGGGGRWETAWIKGAGLSARTLGLSRLGPSLLGDLCNLWKSWSRILALFLTVQTCTRRVVLCPKASVTWSIKTYIRILQ
ncbi:hypothetical protein Y1Q_0013200 [Alligator mississippiensis]|uniref:Uncharacterized protein n=1 Tax=Alligator mississippiensis TaxID=8496 RepID=A0A151NUF6_ALLMI|nr:hypothetical protein Y1Q_0013200 [Alligator mississippiensis]